MRLPAAIGTVLFVFLCAASPAFASGGLSCEARDRHASFQFDGGVTRGMGAPLFNFRGSVRIAAKAVAADLRKLSFGQQHVAQYWLDGENLRLVLYREREGSRPHGYVQITVLARAAGDEGGYKGSYALTVYDTTGDKERTHEAEGRVTCFVE